MEHSRHFSFFCARRGAARNVVILWSCAGVVIVILLILARIPRTFTVPTAADGKPSLYGATTSAQNAPSDTAAAVTATGGDSFSNPPASLPSVDHAAYDAKMLALAHIPPAPVVKATSTTSTLAATGTGAVGSSSESTPEAYPPYAVAPTRAAIARLWPVPVTKAPYPNAGAILPFDRIVAYYGNLYSTQMGVLGEYPEDQMLAMLASTTTAWATADPSTPVVPALDYIAVTAQGSAGADGKYRDRMPDSQVQQILRMAQQINGIVILDVQVGLSNVETEVPLLEQYLKMPQVELALDPEFDMHNGAKPGTVIGSMDASDINWAASYLANLVAQYHLPPKILIVHRFTEDMVTHTAEIAPLPQVQIVMDMDGFGSQAKKLGTYYSVVEPYPVQFTGFKLFYKNDANAGHLMTPQDVLRLSPQPSFIQYQ